MPGDTCLWKRIVNVQGVQHVSIIAIVVDDCLHVYNKLAAREHLHDVMRRERIPRVTVQQLSDSTPISFCGISIEYLRGRGIFMSQPGYLLALVNEYVESERTHPTPLPNNFATRVLSEAQKQPLPGGTGKYLRVLNSIAWRTYRPSRGRLELLIGKTCSMCWGICEGQVTLECCTT